MNESELISDGFEVEFDDESSHEWTRTTGRQNCSGTLEEPANTDSPTAENGTVSKCRTTDNWVLGLRHLSLASDPLNRRMACRCAFAEDMANYSLASPRKREWNLPRHNLFCDSGSSKVVPGSTRPQMDLIDETEEMSSLNSRCQIDKTSFKDKSNSKCLVSTSEQRSTQETPKQNLPVASTTKQLRHEEISIKRDQMECPKMPNYGFCGFESKENLKKDKPSEINLKAKVDDSQALNKLDLKSNNVGSSNERSSSGNKDISKKESVNNKRSVNRVQLTEEQQLQRHRRQLFCESLSLVIIIIAIIFVLITPFLLIPIWVIPNQYSPIIQNLLWLSLGLSALFLALAALTGNVYWYYDPTTGKWKWFYHCGKGPQDHYWGTTLFPYEQENSEKRAKKKRLASIDNV